MGVWLMEPQRPGLEEVALNGSFRFEEGNATFVPQDLIDCSEARIGGKRVPLAADFSAALAFQYYEKTKRVNKLEAMFRPGDFEDTIGLYSLEPYQADRIPLVLVHD